MDAGLALRLAEIDERIAAAARANRRDAGEITRIVVTKFHPARLISDLHGLAVRDVGENRLQELDAKVSELGSLDALRWHAIGQVQTNKAKLVARVAARVPLTVHSIDRDRLATALDAAFAAEGVSGVDVLLQVNLTEDRARGGAAPEDVPALAERVLACPTLVLRGVMAVAPLDEEPASAFARLAETAARVRAVAPEATWLSAGMTGDFEDAIAVGATHLRIGSAITGNRPERG